MVYVGGNLSETEGHLEEYQEFVISCPSDCESEDYYYVCPDMGIEYRVSEGPSVNIK